MNKLYLKQKVLSLTDRYKIYDENNNIIYHCKGNFMSISRTKKLYEYEADKLLFIPKRKLFTLMPRYVLLDPSGNQVALIKKRLSFLKQKLDIESPKGDMRIEGNVWIHDFQVNAADRVVLEVHKKYISWGDTYEITIYDQEDTPFYVALVIMLDDCLHDNRRHN
ncbi:MAG: LURP-one-related family protein [Candidatus Izemoplasmatales bacterium]|nr:LURP-one-related family protein [Candidatus Izemoplasmatales bacterium]